MRTINAGVWITLGVLASAGASAQVTLLANGDAETGLGGGGEVVTVPDWNVLLGDFTAIKYGTSGGYPTASDPGPLDRGLNFFSGGPAPADSSASQEFNLSAYSASIDAGGVTYDLSGYFGGYSSQEDTARLTVTFFDGGGGTLSSATIGDVTAANRGNATGLLFRAASGSVPVNTRSATAVLEMIQAAGVNDGYADNLVVTITGVPEPQWTALLSTAGLIGLVGFRRFNRHSKRGSKSLQSVAADC